MMRTLQNVPENPRRLERRCYGGLFWVGSCCKWLRGLDLNQRPLGYEPNELPGCSTPHSYDNRCHECGQTMD